MPYDTDRISTLISRCDFFNGDGLFYFEKIDSTNTWLLSRKQVHGKICLTEEQSTGKGRRGRSWLAPAGGSILISMGWRLQNQGPIGVSLISGIAVARALNDCGIHGIQLKWPNDILVEGKKLGGILVEISMPDCVIGVGVNVNIPQTFGSAIDQPWVDLESLGVSVDRDEVVASLIRHHERVLVKFESSGFPPFVQCWNELSSHIGKEVEALAGNQKFSGKSLGVDENGALMVQVGDTIKKIESGEVSLRVS